MPGKSKSPKKTIKVTDLSAVKKAKDVRGGGAMKLQLHDESDFDFISRIKK